MSSRGEAGKKSVEDSKSGKLLRSEIESISKALYIDKASARSSSVSKPSSSFARSVSGAKPRLPDPKSKLNHGNEVKEPKDKKSLWNWRSFKPFSRSRRFNCCFSLLVHSIEGLPLSFDDLSLCVYWKRRDGEAATSSCKVRKGKAEFEEKLRLTCSVYGSRNGPHHSAKYDSKHFLLNAAVYGMPELDLGKHRVDLTRLLPLTLEELEEEKSSGSWTTSFKLSGKAKGATMMVSFGYQVIGNNSSEIGRNQNVPELPNQKQDNLGVVKQVPKYGQTDGRSTILRAESLPSNINQRALSASRSMEDIKDLHEVLPASMADQASSIDLSHQKPDEGGPEASVNAKPELHQCNENLESTKAKPDLSASGGQSDECDGVEFSVTVKGTEIASKEDMKFEEVTVNAGEASATEDSHIPVKGPDIVGDDTGIPVKSEEINLEAADSSPTEDSGIPVKVSDAAGDDKRVNVSPEHDNSLTSQEEDGTSAGEIVLNAGGSRVDEICTKKSIMEELESALSSVSLLEMAALDSPEHHRNNMENESDYHGKSIARSRSLDDVTNVESEFLNMLGLEHSPTALSYESEPDSPRERLLREFEKETQGTGYSLFDFDMDEADQAEDFYDASALSGWDNFSEDLELSSMIQAAEEELQIAAQAAESKTKAKLLVDLETEALMHQLGINEKSFQHSPPKASDGFGSPIDLPSEEPPELPLLAEGLGPFLQTKNGGFLRSMSPELFRNSKTGGSLIMQVSNPVVLPAAMGSNVMEILQRLAAVGIEKLSMQASKLMPLEDITGKTIHQVAWEATPSLEETRRQYMLHQESGIDQFPSVEQKSKNNRSSGSRSKTFSSCPVNNQSDSDFGSLEELAPLAVDKIEALSIEGLRVQSGFSDEDAPSNISAQSIGEISALQGKDVGTSGALGLGGTGGLQLLDIKGNGDEVDGLMGLSLTLDEWMRLDSGEIDDGDQISERTSKILAAHHANSLDYVRGGAQREGRRSKSSSKKCGLLGNNFTVALMVQLRDPLRNYEPVGTPMLSLIQVERVFVPSKQKIYRTVSEVRREDEMDEESESMVKDKTRGSPEESKLPAEESIPQYKITEVHIAGLKTEPGKKKTWGTSAQQQSGSRWLLANGMGKGNKLLSMKAKPVSKSTKNMTTKVLPGDTLWSISSRIYGTGAKWKELAALNPHFRNPNIVLPNETVIRLQ